MAVVVSVLVALGCGSKDANDNHALTPDEQAAEAKTRAEGEAAQALKAAQEEQQEVERLVHELEVVDMRLGAAVDRMIAAQSDAERAAAKTTLEQLRRAKADLEQRVVRARPKLAPAKPSSGW